MEVSDSCVYRSTVHPGFNVTEINGVSVSKASFEAITKRLGVGERPMRIKFQATTEYLVLTDMMAQFQAADVDNSGYLDTAELGLVVQNIYKGEKRARGRKVVQAEVDAAVVAFDKDGSGSLNFDEFTQMICQSDEFKLRLTDLEKGRVLLLAARLQGCMDRVHGSPERDRLLHGDAGDFLTNLAELFLADNVDVGGRLDWVEQAGVMTASPYVLMEEEAIDTMINDWPDKKGSRTLLEFLELVCNSPGLKGDLSPEVRARAKGIVAEASQLLARLTAMFAAASDSFGEKNENAIGAVELTVIFKRILREKEGQQPPQHALPSFKNIQDRVEQAMVDWDLDGSGSLELGELLRMYALSDDFTSLEKKSKGVLDLIANAGAALMCVKAKRGLAKHAAASRVQAGIRAHADRQMLHATSKELLSDLDTALQHAQPHRNHWHNRGPASEIIAGAIRGWAARQAVKDVQNSSRTGLGFRVDMRNEPLVKLTRPEPMSPKSPRRSAMQDAQILLYMMKLRESRGAQ